MTVTLAAGLPRMGRPATSIEKTGSLTRSNFSRRASVLPSVEIRKSTTCDFGAARERDGQRVIAGNLAWLARAEGHVVVLRHVELGANHDLDAAVHAPGPECPAGQVGLCSPRPCPARAGQPKSEYGTKVNPLRKGYSSGGNGRRPAGVTLAYSVDAATEKGNRASNTPAAGWGRGRRSWSGGCRPRSRSWPG